VPVNKKPVLHCVQKFAVREDVVGAHDPHPVIAVPQVVYDKARYVKLEITNKATNDLIVFRF
jgi:hypothetical protein